jgi:hypothetical protein
MKNEGRIHATTRAMIGGMDRRVNGGQFVGVMGRAFPGAPGPLAVLNRRKLAFWAPRSEAASAPWKQEIPSG